MSDNEKIRQYMKRKNGAYWHHYHLVNDPQFLEEAAVLYDKLKIIHDDGSVYHPNALIDFDLLNDPNKIDKIKLIKDFQARWCIVFDYHLLDYLILGKVPPVANGYVSLSYSEENNIFTARISPSARKEDLLILWYLVKNEQKRLGIKVGNLPGEKTEKEMAIAYFIWKELRDGVGWSEILKNVEEKFHLSLYDITTAKRYLEARWRFYAISR